MSTKNFYHILGLNQNCSTDDIKKAYHKLALKFHPDKNPNDKYFEERFRDILDAYDILSNGDKRKKHDTEISGVKTKTPKDQNVNFEPKIIEFYSDNKTGYECYKETTLHWKCVNCDYVTISGFGKLPVSGSKTIIIKELEKESVTFKITAYNSFVGSSIDSSIELNNLTLKRILNKDWAKNRTSYYFNDMKPLIEQNHKVFRDKRFLWLYLTGFSIISYFFIGFFDSNKITLTFGQIKYLCTLLLAKIFLGFFIIHKMKVKDPKK